MNVKNETFFQDAVALELLSDDNFHALADGILQHHVSSYIQAPNSEDLQMRMAEALKKHASGVVEAEESYQ